MSKKQRKNYRRDTGKRRSSSTPMVETKAVHAEIKRHGSCDLILWGLRVVIFDQIVNSSPRSRLVRFPIGTSCHRTCWK